MNVDDEKVVGDSGEGIAEVGGGTDEGVGGVYAGTNVVGSDGAALPSVRFSPDQSRRLGHRAVGTGRGKGERWGVTELRRR